MSRQIKQGLDYFPYDCNIDDSQKFIIAEFGLLGLGTVDTILRKIYREKGYYTLWNDDVAFLFASEFHIDKEELTRIVNAALKRGLFDLPSYEKHGILTSKEIQQRYIEATSRRKNVELKEEYALIMYTSCQHNDNKSTQSKVKESKVNQSKPKESKAEQVESQADCDMTAEPTPEKRVYGQFNNVFLTANELDIIKNTLPDWEDCIDRLSEYMFSSGRSYNSHFNTIMLWAKQDRDKKRYNRQKSSQNRGECSFDEDEFFELACKKTEKMWEEFNKLPQNEGA